MTSIISCLVSSPKNPATNESFSTSRRDVGDCRFARTWIFPKLSREYAAEGANLLLVPAWDFNLDRWLHARMAVLRAVENGFALARSARNGLLTLSDNRGRILAESETAPDRFVSITGKVKVSREQTFYARTGDWFAWLCVAVFVSLLAFQLLTPSQAEEKRHA